jgi:hypothetical protein
MSPALCCTNATSSLDPLPLHPSVPQPRSRPPPHQHHPRCPSQAIDWQPRLVPGSEGELTCWVRGSVGWSNSSRAGRRSQALAWTAPTSVAGSPEGHLGGAADRGRAESEAPPVGRDGLGDDDMLRAAAWWLSPGSCGGRQSSLGDGLRDSVENRSRRSSLGPHARAASSQASCNGLFSSAACGLATACCARILVRRCGRPRAITA